MRRLFLALALLSIFSFLSALSCTSIKGIAQAVPACSSVVDNYLILGSGAIHLGLISAALFFLFNKDIGTTLKDIGFPGDLLTVVLFSVAGLMAIFSLLLLVGFASILLNFNDQQNITAKISGLPWYILVLAVLLAPFSEELFFRAFLVPRFGIILPAVLFGLSHLAYGSVVEVLGVIVVGLILGTVFKISKSITPCIVAHLLYNLFSIAMMRFFS